LIEVPVVKGRTGEVGHLTISEPAYNSLSNVILTWRTTQLNHMKLGNNLPIL
jgi:hypothetical protein